MTVEPGVQPGRDASTLDVDTDRRLCDPARFPLLSRHGRDMLRRLHGHPAAPFYRNFSGHRLTRADVWRARWRHALIRQRNLPRWVPGAPLPGWVLRTLAHGQAWVPAHAHRPGPHVGPTDRSLDALPTTCRQDLASQLAQHVPIHLPLDRVICYSTSGTTGHPLRVPSHPDVACDYFAHHARALAAFGVVPSAGRGEVGIVLAGFQRRCFTYVSVNPLRGECGLAKLNLDEGEWRRPQDRATYLDSLRPELISGDPVSLAELLQLDMAHRPRAILSTSMALQPALRHELARRFGCPVVDIYSMNEVGPIGAFVPALDGFLLLQPRLLVEIVDAEGRALPPGERGEVTVTGGFNPWLPLRRYRTGDHAHLALTPMGPVLQALEGRAPVRYRTLAGSWLNNIEITHALAPFALARFALHQAANGDLRLKVDAREDLATLTPRLTHALASCFGPDMRLTIEVLPPGDKVRQYTSALAP
jgi:phenylacetate-CoA ligase